MRLLLLALVLRASCAAQAVDFDAGVDVVKLLGALKQSPSPRPLTAAQGGEPAGEVEPEAADLAAPEPALDEPITGAADARFRRELSVLLKGKAVWGLRFVWLKPDGSAVVLSESAPDRLAQPASTMKLFTGWYGFATKTRPDAYLSKMLQHSVNAMAIALLKEAGGAAAEEHYLRRTLGLKLDGRLVVVDGAGLSHRNFATAGLEVELLRAVFARADYEEFRSLLAQPGLPGTLATRLTDLSGSLYAKTGTLRSAACLAGYVETANGTLVFSILGNRLSKDIGTVRAAIDEAVRRHARLVEGPVVAAPRAQAPAEVEPAGR
jgi:hypothetical protein